MCQCVVIFVFIKKKNKTEDRYMMQPNKQDHCLVATITTKQTHGAGRACLYVTAMLYFSLIKKSKCIDVSLLAVTLLCFPKGCFSLHYETHH